MPLCRSALPPLLLLFLAACGGSAVARLTKAKAVVDSLPGGIPRVMSPEAIAWTDSAAAEMVEEGRFRGEDGSDGELGQPRSLAVDESGRVYVVDSKPAVIKVFAPDGRLIRTLGREGEGPGEFRMGFVAARHGIVALHDPMLSRLTLFDSSGVFLRSWKASCCFWRDIHIDSSRRIYVPSTSARLGGGSYVRWSFEGAVLDTLWLPARESGKLWTVTLKQGGKAVSSMMTSVPFMPEMVHALHPDSGLVFGWTGDYQIVRSHHGTDTATVFGRGWTAEPISEERQKAEVEARVRESSKTYGEDNVRSAFRVEDLPGTFPAYLNLTVDRSGRVWARRFAPTDSPRTAYDVFDAAGAWLGPVVVPARIDPWGLQDWTPTGLVAIVEDEEGRPTVVRFRLVEPPQVN